MAFDRSHAPELVIAARWVVPIEPRGVVLERHAVVIGGGQILALLPAAEIERRFPGIPIVDRPDHVLLPGLVNGHTHAAMTLFRGLADDLSLDAWLRDHIWPAETRWVSEEFVRDGTRLAMLEMIRGGTTCANDMYFFPEVAAGLAIEHGFRLCVGLILLDIPTVWAASSDEYFSKGLEIHDQYRGHPLVQTIFAPHAPYSVGDRPLERLRLLADEIGISVHTHLHETASEIEQSMSATGDRPLARLNRLGLVTSTLSAAHMTQLLPQEIALCAERRVSIVHCAESNLKLASGCCPAWELDQTGVNVALGTDGAASNNDLDMFGEMRTAALLAKLVAGDSRALPAATALQMATLNGARALGLGDRIGSLIPGKCADIIAVNLAHPATSPVNNVISQLVYSANCDQVTDSWIAGQPVLTNGNATTIDERDVLRRADAWRQRLIGA
jgi:5-methylthioadenosine/S-adenosylhomocysteine deaminase